MSRLHVVYYDDSLEEAAEVKRALESATDDLTIRLTEPPRDLGEVTDQQEGVDLFVVDLDLTYPLPCGSPAGYVGTTLVSHLRSLFDDRPVVVLTKESILENLSIERRRHLREKLACDDLVVKQNVMGKQTKAEVARLCSLADGFRELRQANPKSWKEILTGLCVEPQTLEADRLREARPPLERREMTVSAVAGWIRRVLMEYPGILYDDLHAATNLGLSIDSFRAEALQKILQRAQYSGVFATTEFCRYWWKDRLRAIAIAMLEEAGHRGGIIPGFVEVLRTAYAPEVEPSRCVWDGTAGADQVCYLMGKPVKLEHSLAYYADNRPAVMDHARVSYKAIREHTDFQAELLDPAGKELLSTIMHLDDPAVVGDNNS